MIWNRSKKQNLYRAPVLNGIALLVLCSMVGCMATQTDPEEAQPQVFGAHYLDDGGTIVVENGFFNNEGANGISLLEKLEQTSDDLKVQSEKNALIIQEMTKIREARDMLKNDLESVRTQSIDLNEKIAGLKVVLADKESDLQLAFREKQDLLEQIINIKLEKTKIEKELLKIKIAALSGDG